MKYWRGYLAAGILYLMAVAVNSFAKSHELLVDMIVPYMSRYLMGTLAEWSGSVSFCLWQVVVLLAVVGVLASIVVMIVLRGNPIQWFGWVLTPVAAVYFLFSCFWSINFYASPIADDLHLDVTEYSIAELTRATVYFRDEANYLAGQVPRNADGTVNFGSFEEMAEKAGDGFQSLVYDQGYPIFAGSTLPVKKLGWEDYYSSVGITGVTVALTGEAAVNAAAPTVSIPFTICHEMAHRMSIAVERDANFAAYLAADANEDITFRYSANYMAFRYCYITLASVDSAAASKVMISANDLLKKDFTSYDAFFNAKENKKATELSDKANDMYLKDSGDAAGIGSYGNVTDLLTCWYLERIEYEPPVSEEDEVFDPFDETQVDLTGIANAREAYAEDAE